MTEPLGIMKLTSTGTSYRGPWPQWDPGMPADGGLGSDEVAPDDNYVVRAEKRVVGSFAYTPANCSAVVVLSGDVDLSLGTSLPIGVATMRPMQLASGRTGMVNAFLHCERD